MHDIVVLSDLHLGRGKNPETGRYHALEAFFYDDDFRRFCQHVCEEAKERSTPLRLVLNGDVFDFLRIEPEHPRPDAPLRERLFGASSTPSAAARMVRDILAGHPVFVDAVAHVLREGHEVVFLPGNHDLEVQWTPVQEVVRDALAARVQEVAGDAAAVDAGRRLRFEPWFLHEPGRIWIEHGSQHDPECSFRYPLRSALVDRPEVRKQAEGDLPLGNFFQRYLYNAFGPITFIVPSTRANFRYFKWLLFNQPRLLFRVLVSHGPFSVQVLRRMAKSAGTRRALKAAHEKELAGLAEHSGLGERLRDIDAIKNVRLDVTQAASQIGWQLLKLASAIALMVFLAAGLWFAGFQAIHELRLGFWPKAALFLVLNFLFLVAGTVALAYALRSPPAVSPRPFRRAAQRIVDLIDVPMVTFGHTHDEVLWRLRRTGGGKAWYYNTGTWISVFTHDVLYPRERVQFTFLRVREHEAELLHWSPGRNESLPVILLDEKAPEGAPGRKSAPAPPPD